MLAADAAVALAAASAAAASQLNYSYFVSFCDSASFRNSSPFSSGSVFLPTFCLALAAIADAAGEG